VERCRDACIPRNAFVCGVKLSDLCLCKISPTVDFQSLHVVRNNLKYLYSSLFESTFCYKTYRYVHDLSQYEISHPNIV
jgi:hypothetical protein